jgi:hypothetical protein
MRDTSMGVSTEVRDDLKRLAKKGDTDDALLRRLIEDAEVRMLYEREKRVLVTEEFVPLGEG